MEMSRPSRATGRPTHRFLACRACDALMSLPIESAGVFHCPRCDHRVLRAAPDGINRSLALYLTAALLFVMANAFPVVSIEAAGNRVGVSLIGTARALASQQMNVVALLVLTTTVLVPAVDLACSLAALSIAAAPRRIALIAAFLRTRDLLRPWNMVEIFVLGSLVAIVKLSSLASVIVGPGLWSLGGFMLLSSAASHFFDPDTLWQSIETRA